MDRVGNTLFIIKQSPSFWNVFYCSTTIDVLESDLKVFQKTNPNITMMFDIVGRDIQCQPLVNKFKGLGCIAATSLVRMNRMTDLIDYVPDNTIRYATENDLPLISQQLHQFFDIPLIFDQV